MKKLLILVMAVILAVSTVFVTACNKDTTADIPSDSVSESSEQESSSSGQVSRVSKDSGNYSDDSLPPPVSDGSVISGGSASASGDSYTVPQTPTEGLPENIANVVSAINKIGTVSSGNYQQKVQFIELAESRYNALSATDKALVPNIDDLRSARKAYEAFLRSVVVQYIEDFKAKVEAIKGFENTEDFNNKTVVAEAAYKLIDDAYKSEVANEYTVLQAALIHAEVNKVPNADSVNGTYYVTVENLKSKLAGLAQNLISVYPKYNEDVTKLTNCFDKIMEKMVEKTFIVIDTDGDGVVSDTEVSKNSRRSTATDGFFYTSGNGSTSGPMYYSDSKNNNVTLRNTFINTFYFNAPASGVLTYYARMGKDFLYKFYLDGVEVASYETHNGDSYDKNIITVEIPSAGKVEVKAYKISSGNWVETSDGGFFAVKFLYSTL
ncbi:MAG: hypothetical protein ACI4M6_01490 [Christensenellaceae bacterium]